MISLWTLDISESLRKRTIFLYQTILLLTFPVLIYRTHNQITFSKGNKYLPYIILGDTPTFYLKNIEAATIPKFKIETLNVDSVDPIQNATLLMHL